MGVRKEIEMAQVSTIATSTFSKSAASVSNLKEISHQNSLTAVWCSQSGYESRSQAHPT